MQASKWFVAIWLLAAGANAQSPDGLLINPFRLEPANAVQPTALETVASPAPNPAIYGKPITTLGVDITLPEGKLPDDQSQALVSDVQLAANLPRPWPTQVYHWQAAATRHQPLYFEEINAERYGYTCHWTLQPAVSTAHFFGTLPALPYLMAANCPTECQYTLGHYRPGSCPPRRRHWWPADAWGGTFEAGTIAWMIMVFP